jgi:hypothetical protein
MAAQAKISQHLSFVDRQQLFDCFDFDNELTFHHNIHSITTLEPNCFVDQRQGFLATISEARIPEFEAQAFFIDGFEEPGPELAMYIDRQPNHALTQFAPMQKRHRASPCPPCLRVDLEYPERGKGWFRRSGFGKLEDLAGIDPGGVADLAGIG